MRHRSRRARKIEGRATARRLAASTLVAASAACAETDSLDEAVVEYVLRRYDVLAPDSVIQGVLDVQTAEGGRTWVLSTFEPHVVLLDEEGVIRSFGRRGPGPSEILRPWYLVPHPRGIGVVDVGARVLKVFTDSSVFLAEHPLPAPGWVMAIYGEWNFGEPFRVRPFGGGYLVETYRDRLGSSGAFWSGQLVMVRPGDQDLETVLRYDKLPDAPTSPPVTLFAAPPLWTTCPDGSLFVLNPSESTLHIARPDGSREIDRIPLVRDELTTAMLPDYAARRLEVQGVPATGAQLSGAIREMEGLLATVSPPTRMLCDDRGRAWVAGFSVEDDIRGYGRTWQVFDGERALARVTFPPRVLPYVIAPDRILAVWRDDVDIERVVSLENPL